MKLKKLTEQECEMARHLLDYLPEYEVFMDHVADGEVNFITIPSEQANTIFANTALKLYSLINELANRDIDKRF